MTSLSSIRRNSFVLLFLLVLVTLQTGCSINARQYAWSAYESRDPAIDQWPMLQPRSKRTLLLATYASTDYTRSNKIASDAELISGDTPVILAWIEFKNDEQLIPLYRYIIVPLKSITAEELLRQGKYIANLTLQSRSLPAKTPATVTNGAVVTDWQYCYDCITSVPLEDLNAAGIAYIAKETERAMQSKPLDEIYFINSPTQAPYLKARESILVYTGDAAIEQQALLATYVAGLSGAIAEANQYDAEYRRFTDMQHTPLTFDYWAKQAGCPMEIANRREIHGDRRSQANTIIELNKRYIECNSAALQSYNLGLYTAEYESLYTREEVLWERSSKSERYRVIGPEDTINGVIQRIDQAAQGLESAYDQLALADKLDARNQQLDAFSRQNWENTFSSIQARNNNIQVQQRQTQKIIQSAQSNKPDTAGLTHPAKPHNQPQSKPQNKPSDAAQTASTVGSSRTEDNETSSQSTHKQIAPAEQKPPQSDSAKEKHNNYVGSGRDYPFTGNSGTFFQRELAEDLARDNLMNQAAEFCGGGIRTEIIWAEQAICKPSASEQGSFKCSIDGLVNCYENVCDVAFCGTAM